MKTPQARRGRPMKGQELGGRIQLSLRVTPSMKKALDDAAAGSGRSQSQEAEYRLERSFDRDDLLPGVLKAVYGREAASLIVSIAEAMTNTGQWAVMIAEGGMSPAAGRAWPQHPFAFQEAMTAAIEALKQHEPKGEVKAPPRGKLLAYIPEIGSDETFGEHIARAMRKMLDGTLTPPAYFRESLDRIRQLEDKR